MLLGHPQPDIGGAGEEAGVRVLCAQLGQLGERARREKALPMEARRRPVADACSGRLAGSPARRRRSSRAAGLRRRAVDDRADSRCSGTGLPASASWIVSRSSALRRSLVQREQRHHEARRAEAALRAVACRPSPAAPDAAAPSGLQVLDREQRLAVERRQELDAGIDRAKVQSLAMPLGEHDGAGAAIALGAAFLGADRSVP